MRYSNPHTGLSGMLAGLAVGCWLLAILFASSVAAASRLPAAQPQLQIEAGAHAGPVRRLAVSPRQGLVLTASDDKTARLWDLASGELRRVIRPAVGDGELGRLYGAAIHPSAPVVAIAGTTGNKAGGHRILRLSSDTGQLIDSIDARAGDIKHLAYTADGELLLAAYAGDHGLRAFDTQGRLVFEHRFESPAYGLDVSSDGLIAVTEMNGFVHLYGYSAGRISADKSLRTSGRLPVSVAISPDSRHLALGFFASTNGAAEPEIIALPSGLSVRRLGLPARLEGNLMTVAWTPDGQRVMAGGTAYDGVRAFALYEYDAPTGKLLHQQVLANNSITDLVPVGGTQLAYTSFDGSWGTIDLASRGVRRTGGELADLRGPGKLRISADARRIAFDFDYGATPVWFDFDRRLLTPGQGPDDLRPARIRASALSQPEWANQRRIRVNGATLTLASDEVGRSLASFDQSDDVMLGTSKTLYRIGANGAVRWQRALGAESHAVNIAGDDRIAVAALSDGTIRWFSTTDGTAMMALMPQRGGQWVLWTPEGSFDASAGADRYIGWAVNRSDEPLADFFSLNRLREPFNDPAAIDKVLASARGERTIATSPAVLPPLPAADQAPVTVTIAPVRPGRPRSITRLQFPPVLKAIGLSSLVTKDRQLDIPFALHADLDASVEVRVNGRPLSEANIRLPLVFDGRVSGLVSLTAPEPGSVIQLIARDRHGVSEPLGLTFDEPADRESSLALPMMPTVPAPTTTASFTGLPPAAPIPGNAGLAQPDRQTAARESPPATARAPDRPAANTRLFVLSIGVSDYRNPQYRLGLAAKDSRDFSAAVARQEGRQYGQVVVRSLTDAQADRASVLASLRWLSESVGPQDIGMLFMAGHGINASDGQYYFLPFDGDHQRLADTAVAERSIRETLGTMKGRALFFVDTCHAGNAVGNMKSASRELARLANNLAATENGVVVFASSSGRQLLGRKRCLGQWRLHQGPDCRTGRTSRPEPQRSHHLQGTGLLHFRRSDPTDARTPDAGDHLANRHPRFRHRRGPTLNAGPERDEFSTTRATGTGGLGNEETPLMRRNLIGPAGALALLLTAGCGGGGGGSNTSVAANCPPVGVCTGFVGDFDFERRAEGEGGSPGIGGGADGDGGIGAGGALGQFRNALVVVTFPDGSELGRAKTDPVAGMVTIRPGRDYNGALLVEIRGQPDATYFEEGKNTYVPFGEGRVLRALVPSITKNIGITPFSEAAYQLAEQCRLGTGPGEVCRTVTGSGQWQSAGQ